MTAIYGTVQPTQLRASTPSITANLALAALMWILCILLLTMARTIILMPPLVTVTHGMVPTIRPHEYTFTLTPMQTIVPAPTRCTSPLTTATRPSITPPLATAYFGMEPHITLPPTPRHTLPPMQRVATAW